MTRATVCGALTGPRCYLIGPPPPQQWALLSPPCAEEETEPPTSVSSSADQSHSKPGGIPSHPLKSSPCVASASFVGADVGVTGPLLVSSLCVFLRPQGSRATESPSALWTCQSLSKSAARRRHTAGALRAHGRRYRQRSQGPWARPSMRLGLLNRPPSHGIGPCASSHGLWQGVDRACIRGLSSPYRAQVLVHRALHGSDAFTRSPGVNSVPLAAKTAR